MMANEELESTSVREPVSYAIFIGLARPNITVHTQFSSARFSSAQFSSAKFSSAKLSSDQCSKVQQGTVQQCTCQQLP
jgi:uncharacterized protein YjbI with pentapeptide repeats